MRSARPTLERSRLKRLSQTDLGQVGLERRQLSCSRLREDFADVWAGPDLLEPQGGTEGDIPTQSSDAGAATWDTIEILSLSDERVQIRNGTNTETRNYGELGFADARDGKPNQAWVTLRALAEERGTIRDAAKTLAEG